MSRVSPMAKGWFIKIKKPATLRVDNRRKELTKSRGSLIKY
jgi:hypothetical protein